MISVIIPTLFKVDDEFFQAAIEEYVANENITEITIIDNTEDKIGIEKEYLHHPKIIIVNGYDNLYVNAAWNLGARLAENDILLFVNDDIFCPKDLVTAAELLLGEDVGLVTYTTSNFVEDEGILNDAGVKSRELSSIKGYLEQIRNMYDNYGLKILKTFRRHGMFMMMRKEDWVPIPDDLIIWCGDDWIYQSLKEKGKYPIQLYPFFVYHQHGGSVTCDIWRDPKIFQQCVNDENTFKNKYKKNL